MRRLDFVVGSQQPDLERFPVFHQPSRLQQALNFFPHQFPHMIFPFYPWRYSSLHPLNSCFPYLPRLPVAIHLN